MKFRKKPVVIDAVQWLGRESDLETVMPFFGDFSKLPNPHGMVNPGVGHIPAAGQLDIPTLEGMITASPGDWIIKGVKGEFYPCKPDIFEATYEREYELGECRNCGTIYPVGDGAFCPEHGFCTA